MTAPEGAPTDPRDEIAHSLRRRAADLWGPERAALLEPVIEEVASNLLRLSQDPPPHDEEPGFYFRE